MSLRVGVPLEGNKLLRSETIALEASSGSRKRWSRLTALLQLPWEPILARLRPVAEPAAVRPSSVGPR